MKELLDTFQSVVNKAFHRFYLNDISYYKAIKRGAYNNRNIIENDQLNRLNELLNHASENVPYYKELLDKYPRTSNKIQLKSLDELRNIPFLDKEVIRSEKEKLYDPNHKQRQSFFNTSGGSTGAPIPVLQDREYTRESSGTFLFIKELRTGHPFSDVVNLWGAHRDLYGLQDTWKGRMKSYINNTLMFNSAKLTKETIEGFIDVIDKNPPSMILAYVNSIYEVAKYAKDNNIKVSRQKSIHTGAGQLFPFMRDVIESVFDCKVFNHYGGREFGAIATECKQGDGLHILEHNRVVEIINENGEPCEPGEEGEVVVTVLNNYSMPLIRYKVGDRSILSPNSICKCGIKYKKLTRITGRTSNNFPLPDGGFVSGEYLTLSYNHIPGIVNFQFRQKQLNEIIIYLVVDEKYELSTEGQIGSKMNKLFGDLLILKFEYVDTIPTTATGKHLFTVSEIV